MRTSGAVEIIENKGFVFRRFTRDQEEQYARYHNSLLTKTYSSSGICMEFVTDTCNLYMDIDLSEGSTRRFYAFDILCDNQKVDCITNFAEGDDLYRHDFKLGRVKRNITFNGGTKTVKIVFPWSVAAKINEISIDDNATVEPLPQKPKMLFFGDSITQGYDALYPTESYVYRISDMLGVECYNKAIGAECYFPELLKYADDFQPEFISVAYGTNDWNRLTWDAFQRNCAEFYKLLATNYPSSKIFAIAPLWRKDLCEKRPIGDFKNIRDYIFKVTEKYENVTAIDGYGFVPQEERYFSDLRLHPNSEGFKHYAENLFSQLKQHING